MATGTSMDRADVDVVSFVSSIRLIAAVFAIGVFSVVQSIVLARAVRLERRTPRDIWAHLTNPSRSGTDDAGSTPIAASAVMKNDDRMDRSGALGSYSCVIWGTQSAYLWILGDRHAIVSPDAEVQSSVASSTTKVRERSPKAAALLHSTLRLMEDIVVGRVDTLAFSGMQRRVIPLRSRRTEWNDDIPFAAGRPPFLTTATTTDAADVRARARYFVYPSSDSYDAWYDETHSTDRVILCCELKSMEGVSILPLDIDASDKTPATKHPIVAHVVGTRLTL